MMEGIWANLSFGVRAYWASERSVRRPEARNIGRSSLDNAFPPIATATIHTAVGANFHVCSAACVLRLGSLHPPPMNHVFGIFLRNTG